MSSIDVLSKLDSKDLLYAVRRLVADRKVTVQRIQALATQRSQRIAAVTRELEAVRSGQVASATGRGSERPSARRPKATKRKKRAFTMTPKARAARKLQGRYLGLLRKIKGANRAKVKALAKKSGVTAAVKLAARLAK